MDFTFASWIWWLAGAVAVFWAVGAYNRLVRLRADANAAFGLLEAQLARQIELVRECLPDDEEPASQFDGGSAFWGGLRGAAGQLGASLNAAKVRPLDAERMAALGAAQQVLEMAWERAERDDAHDLAGPRLPAKVTAERALVVRQAQMATAQFNDAVVRYNDGIRQFPAIMLAWLFGFRPARGLRTR